jgi:hypothetical protein
MLVLQTYPLPPSNPAPSHLSNPRGWQSAAPIRVRKSPPFVKMAIILHSRTLRSPRVALLARRTNPLIGLHHPLLRDIPIMLLATPPTH